MQRFTRCDVRTCYFRAARERLPKQKHAETAGSHVARSQKQKKVEKEASVRPVALREAPVLGSLAPHTFMVLLRHISVALTAAVAALGSALFIALNFFYKRRMWSPQAEYCTIKEVRRSRRHRIASPLPANLDYYRLEDLIS